MEQTLKKLRKKAIKRVVEFIAGDRGMAALNTVFKTKKKTDRRLDALYHLAGLPSLTDKSAVSHAIDAQGRRLRSLTKELDEMDAALARLEQSEARHREERKTVRKPARTQAKVMPPKAKATSPLGELKAVAHSTAKTKTRVRAAKPKAVAAKQALKPTLPKPSPLGTAKKGKRTAPSKKLLDLNFKKAPLKKKK